MVAVVAAGPAWGGLRAAAHVAWQHAARGARGRERRTDDGIASRAGDRAGAGGLPLGLARLPQPGRPALCWRCSSRCARIGPDDGLAAARRIEALVDDGARAGAAARGVPGSPRRVAPIASSSPGSRARCFWADGRFRASRRRSRRVASCSKAAGAAWLLAKTWTLVLGLAVLREALPARRLADGSRTTTRRELPLAIAALLATAAWTRWSPEGAAQLLVSGSLVAIAALAAVVVVQRLRHGVLSPGGDGHLSPFL